MTKRVVVFSLCAFTLLPVMGQDAIEAYKKQKKKASSAYDSAKENYVNKSGELTENQAKQSQYANEYNTQYSQYTNELATLNSLEDAVKQLQVQAQVEQSNLTENIAYINSQFQATKASLLDGLRRELAEYQTQHEKTAVKSTVSGVVSDLMISQGTAVGQGTGILQVKGSSSKGNRIILYVPVQTGKKILKGMEVLVYPTTVNKQEYGHMEAVVEQVDEYVASSYDMQGQLGNEGLVNLFTQNGPVVAVSCRLTEDAGTASGYYWSSRKGADVTIVEGTIVEANVVIEEKAPITMLIPYLKEKLTIKAAE